MCTIINNTQTLLCSEQEQFYEISRPMCTIISWALDAEEKKMQCMKVDMVCIVLNIECGLKGCGLSEMVMNFNTLIRAGPWSNGRWLPGLMKQVCFYSM